MLRRPRRKRAAALGWGKRKNQSQHHLPSPPTLFDKLPSLLILCIAICLQEGLHEGFHELNRDHAPTSYSTLSHVQFAQSSSLHSLPRSQPSLRDSFLVEVNADVGGGSIDGGNIDPTTGTVDGSGNTETVDVSSDGSVQVKGGPVRGAPEDTTFSMKVAPGGSQGGSGEEGWEITQTI
jgi:hypothetical protein